MEKLGSASTAAPRLPLFFRDIRFKVFTSCPFVIGYIPFTIGGFGI